MSIALKDVAHALDQVSSAGQAQAAVRAALQQADHVIATAPDKFHSFDDYMSPANIRRRLGERRAAIVKLAKAVDGIPGAKVRDPLPTRRKSPSWAALHAALNGFYGDLYAIDETQPGASFGDAVAILAQSIAEAPAVFLKAASDAVLKPLVKATAAPLLMLAAVLGGVILLVGGAWVLVGKPKVGPMGVT